MGSLIDEIDAGRRRPRAEAEELRGRIAGLTTALAGLSARLACTTRCPDVPSPAGQPALAQESLARKNAGEAELGELRDQDQSLWQQADRLEAACQRLQAKAGAFVVRRKQATGNLIQPFSEWLSKWLSDESATAG